MAAPSSGLPICIRPRRSTATFQPTVDGATLTVTQQINTPITTDGTYIYYGSWSGNSAGHYYQTKISDGTTKVFTPDAYGFYWPVLSPDGTNVYFGGDNGMLYWRSIDAFDTTGGYYDLTWDESEAGNVRSSIMLDDGYLYFTSQGGFVWCCLFDPGYNQLAVEWVLDIGVKSTSTPTKVGKPPLCRRLSGLQQRCALLREYVNARIHRGHPLQCEREQPDADSELHRCKG